MVNFLIQLFPLIITLHDYITVGEGISARSSVESDGGMKVTAVSFLKVEYREDVDCHERDDNDTDKNIGNLWQAVVDDPVDEAST